MNRTSFQLSCCESWLPSKEGMPVKRTPFSMIQKSSPSESFCVSDPRKSGGLGYRPLPIDRKSTRLNSSHLVISYAVFCLKKKKYHKTTTSFSVRERESRDPTHSLPGADET